MGVGVENNQIAHGSKLEQGEHKNGQEQDGLPLTAAGLTRTLETNQGQSLGEILNISAINPSHLFWVPASQHPELAPTEFEKYVNALRANAKDKGKVKRRQSVLSVSFTADDDDNDATSLNNDDDDLNRTDEERQSALDILENNHYQSISLSLTNNNNNNDHPISPNQTAQRTTKIRKEKLRRSISLQLSDSKDSSSIPEFLVFDRHSTTLDQSPVLVPKADRPLSRRGARTRFQRNNQAQQCGESSGNSSSTDDSQLGLHTILSTITNELRKDQQQQQDGHIEVSTNKMDDNLKKGTPTRSHKTSNTTAASLKDQSTPSYQSTPKPSSPRERKSSWSWSFWSDDKKAKADQPSNDKEIITTNEAHRLPPMTTSASTPTNSTINKHRFVFSSLFSRKPSSSAGNTTESATMPPKDFMLNRNNHQHRLPINMERAVYRLSHIKLANPRRPLHDQVIISNFMFWYLSITSQQQQQESAQQQSPVSKKKKNRLIRKSEQQKTATASSTKNSSPKHPQQLHSTPQQHTKSWQTCIDNSTNQQSTGFVIPDDYLHPSSLGNTHKCKSSRQPRHYERRCGNSSSDSSEDEDDNKSLYTQSPLPQRSHQRISPPIPSFKPGPAPSITNNNTITS
ncbi:hypothetical protein BC941DRAFT_449281 [Chlamydoabsidia padenii]|nr:hypothetical protein BC941DRAFT_449281 [Chlamydoabsidia padenii]